MAAAPLVRLSWAAWFFTSTASFFQGSRLSGFKALPSVRAATAAGGGWGGDVPTRERQAAGRSARRPVRGLTSQELPRLDLEVPVDQGARELRSRRLEDQGARARELTDDGRLPAQELRRRAALIQLLRARGCSAGTPRRRAAPLLPRCVELPLRHRLEIRVLQQDHQGQVTFRLGAHLPRQRPGGVVVHQLREEDQEGAAPELEGDVREGLVEVRLDQPGVDGIAALHEPPGRVRAALRWHE